MLERLIVVLMSTYNGEKYLRQQIDSIFSQTYKHFKVYVRDDGSGDTTRDILASYNECYDNFEWIAGENVGTSKSLFILMSSIQIEDAIYVFADQDDVWMPYKLKYIAGVFSQYKKTELLLYCGDTILINDKGKILKYKNIGKNICPSFGNALIENICIGCTAAMNDMLLLQIVKVTPQYMVMHDWWFYLTASCFGRVIYDEKPLIYYRQHRDNVMGSGTNRIIRFIKRLKNHKRHKGQIGKQAREFFEIFHVEGKNAYLIKCVEEYKNGKRKCWRLIKNKDIHRQRKMDDVLFKILFILKQL